MSKNSFLKYIISNIQNPNEDKWGIGANLNSQLNLSSLTTNERKVIKELEDEYENVYQGARDTIAPYGMLRIQETAEGFELFVFTIDRDLAPIETHIKYLDLNKLERLTKDNDGLWFDVYERRI